MATKVPPERTFMRNKGYRNISNGEYKARTDWLSFLLFLILTLLVGYISLKVIAIFYLKSEENALYTVPVRTCLRGGDMNFGGEEYPLVYMGDNSVMSVLVPVIETAEVREPDRKSVV